MEFYDKIMENTKRVKKENKMKSVSDCLKIATNIKGEIQEESDCGRSAIVIIIDSTFLYDCGLSELSARDFSHSDKIKTLISVLEKTIGYKFDIKYDFYNGSLRLSIYWREK